ncbi:MAG TPA: sodium:solute symporter [Bacteroidales bacterium]|nr:sodium:solute symporter [Bacteroidales bacterium]HOL98933.1 sodium:solute symporter [Bacteroidales bacterium]HOM36885.1 sodium:solute symporter [Bacteroidales bacterium]HPD24205.1 sodium:solute symporter [Bacteroidales bacterium]HRS99890.1 sodium:solute symporter [Bacteroidales bacterium]
MNSLIVLAIVLSYFGILILISVFTSKNVNSEGFFLGNRKSRWYIVAFGMLGSSISGVTFISVPGWVQTTDMTYMQMVFGYFLGYLFIAHVLLPVYYKLQLTSIYTYLEKRFDTITYKTGASFFLLSRTIGSAFRLFIVANVLQVTIFNELGIPFYLTVCLSILLIWVYTFRGGIKTIIWTDTLQTFFLFATLIATIVIISSELKFNFSETVNAITESKYFRIFEFYDWKSSQHFVKQFISGALVTIVMTGLDQDMMQKNLSCKSLKDAKKNVISYGFAFIPANLLFLSLGVLLMIFATSHNIDTNLIKGDNLYPIIASRYLGTGILILFLIGLMASAYSSADSALTALTTSFTVDIIGIKNKTENQIKKIRTIVHIGFSILMATIIIIFNIINEKSVIDAIFTIAGYTYGPLLGIYAYGLFTKRTTNGKAVPFISILSPVICFFTYKFLLNSFDYKMGYELLLLNGIITFIGLWIFGNKNQ